MIHVDNPVRGVKNTLTTSYFSITFSSTFIMYNKMLFSYFLIYAIRFKMVTKYYEGYLTKIFVNY